MVGIELGISWFEATRSAAGLNKPRTGCAFQIRVGTRDQATHTWNAQSVRGFTGQCVRHETTEADYDDIQRSYKIEIDQFFWNETNNNAYAAKAGIKTNLPERHKTAPPLDTIKTAPPKVFRVFSSKKLFLINQEATENNNYGRNCAKLG
ncbi:hypothetical protein EVAR_33892_1 [Eumeta japonica]|uniref:Uncharacterized protein n=1 Tax=Eumeta variegata TaxID=151549 RepID=A0A4C1WIU3_EUMVA|nr:hypothetical protein EVAR_33892_1 [Eumeta japonica]